MKVFEGRFVDSEHEYIFQFICEREALANGSMHKCSIAKKGYDTFYSLEITYRNYSIERYEYETILRQAAYYLMEEEEIDKNDFNDLMEQFANQGEEKEVEK